MADEFVTADGEVVDAAELAERYAHLRNERRRVREEAMRLDDELRYLTDDFALVIREQDALAIAALPERIAREDRVREVCADRMLRSAKFPGSISTHAEGTLARHILRILDGEEGA